MPRLVLGILLSAALAAASASPSAAALDGSLGRRSSGIELLDGSGQAYLSLRGAVLGSLGRGQLTVTIVPGRQGTDVLVQGEKWQRRVSATTAVYGGEGLRFRVFRGTWRVRLQGSGINVSAAGRGSVRFRGTGRYSVGGQAYQLWRAAWTTIRLGS